MLEWRGIADGFEAADRVAKEAPVELLLCQPVSPGKFVVLFSGEVSDVTSSLRVGRESEGAELIDQLLLPQADPSVAEAVRGTRDVAEMDAVGVVESHVVASLLVAADVAVKTAEVELLRIRLAMGLGGKAFVTLTGEVSQVRAAVNAAAGFLDAQGLRAGQAVIPQPHPQLEGFLR